MGKMVYFTQDFDVAVVLTVHCLLLYYVPFLSPLYVADVDDLHFCMHCLLDSASHILNMGICLKIKVVVT